MTGISLFAPIRPPLADDEVSVHAQAVEDGRGCDRVEDLAPLGGDEVGSDDGRADLGPLGDDLEEGIGLVFGRDDIAQLIQTQERDLGIILDEAESTFGLGQFRGEVEESDEDRLVTLEDGLMTEGGREMGLADAGGTDQDQV